MSDGDDAAPEARALRRLMHLTIRKVTEDIEEFAFNTMVAAMIEFTNALMAQRETAVAQTKSWRDAVETLVLLMAPQHAVRCRRTLATVGPAPIPFNHRSWPEFDPALLTVDQVELVVQINGKVRDRLTIPAGLAEAAALEQVRDLPKIREQLGDQHPAKVIYVPDRLINLVVKG